ncbi:sugar transferase [Desulfovibrio inopinatus]|uniref:sugar transferase n=1 Tax=Desulfovibrio inopinatus TaxID=102109 RepID=UPI000684BC29|nr:sugar transferase [Desulfovibrio inopinatus]
MMNPYSRFTTQADPSETVHAKPAICVGPLGRHDIWPLAVFIISCLYDALVFFMSPIFANIVLLQFEYVYALPLTKSALTFPVGLTALFQTFILFFFGVYNQQINFLNLEDAKRTFLGLILGLACAVPALAAFRAPHVASLVLSSFPLTFIMVFYGRLTVNDRLCALRKKCGTPALIYGAGNLGREIYSLLNCSSKTSLHPVAFIDDDPEKLGISIAASSLFQCDCLNVMGTRDDIDRLIHELGIREIFIAFAVRDDKHMEVIVRELAGTGLTVNILPSLYHLDRNALEYFFVDGIPAARVVSITTPQSFSFKRFFDLVITAGLLAALWPIFCCIALAVKLDSKGPVIFAHDRIGKDGKSFTMYKFRSMTVDACPYQVNPTKHCDPRLTRVGRILRKTSLDELPQLFNVLKGDMSLVGPRPEMQFIVDDYDKEARRRLEVLPGITGLWQISVDRKHAIHENLSYDLYYIRNSGVLLDIVILLKTIAFLFRGI